MEISQVSFNFGSEALMFEVGNEGVKRIVLDAEKATVYFDGDTEFTIMRNFIITYTKGSPFMPIKAETKHTNKKKKVVRKK